MEASSAAGSVFRSDDETWSFRSAFLAGEPPVVSVAAEHADAIGCSILALSGFAVRFRIIAHSTITGSITIRAETRGRWSSIN